MSSDVQDMNRGVTDTTLPRMCLEDLKEASDEADQENRLLMPENEPDIFYIPFNLLKFSQR